MVRRDYENTAVDDFFFFFFSFLDIEKDKYYAWN